MERRSSAVSHVMLLGRVSTSLPTTAGGTPYSAASRANAVVTACADTVSFPDSEALTNADLGRLGCQPLGPCGEDEEAGRGTGGTRAHPGGHAGTTQGPRHEGCLVEIAAGAIKRDPDDPKMAREPADELVQSPIIPDHDPPRHLDHDLVVGQVLGAELHGSGGRWHEPKAESDDGRFLHRIMEASIVPVP